MLLILVAKDSLAMNAALHQFEPSPPVFCDVMLPDENDEFIALVKALHSALFRLVS
jgi:hypothetical protein